MNKKNLTILICTHNRADLLIHTIDSLNKARKADFLLVRIIVVANACTDNTISLVQNYKSNIPLSCAVEPIAGKSYALNHGINLIENGIISFIDDDQCVADDFFLAIQSAIEKFSDSSILCGKIIPNWNGTEPDWVHHTGKYQIFPPPITAFDLGESVLDISHTDELPPGGTLIVHKEVFNRVGNFSVAMGPTGHNLVGGEDSEFILRALGSGESITYIPTIVQYHYVDPERLRLGYLMQKSFQRTRSVIVAEHSKKQPVPLYLWRKLSTYFFKLIFSFNLQKIRFYLMRVSATLGEISGFRSSTDQFD
jgi:GT2 family glycosyltransferase